MSDENDFIRASLKAAIQKIAAKRPTKAGSRESCRNRILNGRILVIKLAEGYYD
jgi:hypothetical protein